jgi:tRNA (cytidine/uridine-2'-O-)-methyltransferase
MLNLVLLMPDIPQNLGAVLRLSACMGARIHVVEPCGFPFSHAKLRRAGMDYIDKSTLVRHADFSAFLDYHQGVPGRLLLLETDGTRRYTDIAFQPSDYILLGSEGAGTPRDVYGRVNEVITIPMREGVRSLNVAMAAGMVVAEACRQKEWEW